MIYRIFGRFSGVWVCQHDVGYYDVCDECNRASLLAQMNKMIDEQTKTTNKEKQCL